MDLKAKLRMGNAHHRAGRLTAAMTIYEAVLRDCPDHPDALHLSGLVAHQRGDSQEAIRRILGAVAQDPQKTAYMANLYRVLLAAGHAHLCRQAYPEAVDCLSKAMEIQPNHADLHHNLGVAYQEMGQMQKAISHYQTAIQLNPGLAEAHYNLGNTLRMVNGIDDAVVAAYQSALAIRSDYVDARFNLGKAFDELERIEEAIDCYRHTLRLDPDFVDAHNSLGNAYLKLGQHLPAMTCYEQAIRIDPHFHEAFYNMALAAKLQGRLDEAAALAEQALAIHPEFGEASSLRVQIYQQACAWSELEPASAHLDVITEMEIAAGRSLSEQPFLSFARHIDPALNLRVARAWSDAAAARIMKMGGPFVHDHRKRQNGKVVIGYVSERFRNAATAHLMLQLFGLHDRQRFTVHAYSYGKDDDSPYRKRIAQDADRFIDIRHLSDRDAAKRIHDDGVDILVDLMGYMKDNRIGIFAFRPAPLQVEYLGYPATTGAAFMDYLIADHVVVPHGQEAFFAERIVRLPDCYQVNDRTQKMSAKRFSRQACGLPEHAFVYASFNTDYKIDRDTFQTWMSILNQVPESVLWLLVRSTETRHHLIQSAAREGVSQDRLVFAESLPKHEHLARIKLADLALDTRIVNGHTTTSDCLWVDLPVVTLKGNHFASRVSASLLEAVGLPDLICDSRQAYESLAVGLARDRQRLSAVRNRLSAQKMTAALFNSTRTVRSLEAAYRRMWQHHCQGRRPQAFDVEPPESGKAQSGH